MTIINRQVKTLTHTTPPPRHATTTQTPNAEAGEGRGNEERRGEGRGAGEGRQEAREQLVQMAANMYRSEGVNQQTSLLRLSLKVVKMEKSLWHVEVFNEMNKGEENENLILEFSNKRIWNTMLMVFSILLLHEELYFHYILFWLNTSKQLPPPLNILLFLIVVMFSSER